MTLNNTVTVAEHSGDPSLIYCLSLSMSFSVSLSSSDPSSSSLDKHYCGVGNDIISCTCAFPYRLAPISDYCDIHSSCKARKI